MAEEREPGGEDLAELRAAWCLQQPARSVDETGEDGMDPSTRRAVEWLRAAWREAPVPAPRLPSRAVVRRRPAAWLDRGAALAAAVLLALLLYSVVERESPRSPSEAPRGPHVAAIGDDRIELRSGPVTLVIVTGGAAGGPTQEGRR